MYSLNLQIEMKNISVFKFRFDSINMFSLMLNIGDKRVRNLIMLIKKKTLFVLGNYL